MNILHHKSWHVGRRDNIERVMRDEKQAKEEAEKKAAKVIQADQEARLNLLRSKSQLPSIQPIETGGHVNLFQKEEDLAKRAMTHAPNDEFEAERLAKEAKDKKKDVSYLGEGSVEFSRQTPWYQKKDKKTEFSENQGKILKANDPMAEMEVYLNQMKGIFPKTEREKQFDAREARRRRGRERFEDKKRKLDEIATPSNEETATKKPKHTEDPVDHSSSSSDSSDSGSDSSSDSEGSEKKSRKHHKKGHKKDKQHQKEKKKKRKAKEKEAKEAKKKQEEAEEEQKQQQQREKLAKMRDERTQREREEREKVSKYEKDLGTPMDIYRHRYYSQFNPSHAKPSFTPNRK